MKLKPEVGRVVWYHSPSPNAWAPDKIIKGRVADNANIPMLGSDYVIIRAADSLFFTDVVRIDRIFDTEVEACEHAIEEQRLAIKHHTEYLKFCESAKLEMKRANVCLQGLEKHLERAKRREKKAGTVKRADDIVWTVLGTYPARTHRYALNPGQKCFETEKDAWREVATGFRQKWEEAAVKGGARYVVTGLGGKTRLFFLPRVDEVTEYCISGYDQDGCEIRLPLTARRQCIFKTREEAAAAAKERREE